MGKTFLKGIAGLFVAFCIGMTVVALWRAFMQTSGDAVTSLTINRDPAEIYQVVTDPAAVFRPPLVPRRVPRPLWPLLLGLSALGLVLDVAARRLDFRRDPPGTPAAVPGAAPARGWVAAPARGISAEAAPVADLPPPSPEVPEDSYAGRLLAARRAARKKVDRDR